MIDGEKYSFTITNIHKSTEIFHCKFKLGYFTAVHLGSFKSQCFEQQAKHTFLINECSVHAFISSWVTSAYFPASYKLCRFPSEWDFSRSSNCCSTSSAHPTVTNQNRIFFQFCSDCVAELKHDIYLTSSLIVQQNFTIKLFYFIFLPLKALTFIMTFMIFFWPLIVTNIFIAQGSTLWNMSLS